MSVLIVGGAGYIGSHTAQARGGLRVSRRSSSTTWSTATEWAVKWGTLIKGDLADAEPRRALSRAKHQAVIHFAAYAYVGESVTDPGKYFRNNVVGTINLLDAMVAVGVRDLVFSSTCATYGEPRRVPDHRESSAEPGQPLRRDQAGRRAC